MKYTIYREPFTHIVIDDWLSEEDNQTLLKESIDLIPYMHISKVGSSIGSVIAPQYKNSTNLWLFQHYAVKKPNFNIAEYFEKTLWSDDVKNIFRETKDSMFETMLYTDRSQILLSRYEEGGHYEWHRDYNPTVTINYMLAREPLKFQGGEFVFGSWDEKTEFHKIEFKNNRLIAFPSRVLHKVNPVVNFTGNSSEARFTLQYWSKLKDSAET